MNCIYWKLLQEWLNLSKEMNILYCFILCILGVALATPNFMQK